MVCCAALRFLALKPVRGSLCFVVEGEVRFGSVWFVFAAVRIYAQKSPRGRQKVAPSAPDSRSERIMKSSRTRQKVFGDDIHNGFLNINININR